LAWDYLTNFVGWIDVGINFVAADEMTLLVARNSLKFFAPLARPQPIRITGVLPSQHEIYLSSHVLHPPSTPPRLSPRTMRELARTRERCKRCYGLLVSWEDVRTELARRIKADYNVVLDDELVGQTFADLEKEAVDVREDLVVEVLLDDDEAVARAPWGKPYAHSFNSRMFFPELRRVFELEDEEEEAEL